MSRKETAMKRAIIGALAILIATLPAALHGQSATPADGMAAGGPIAPQTPGEAIQEWSRVARAAALVMISKYGEPEDFGTKALVWNSNGPWRQTIVSREPKMHRAVMSDKDYVRQSVNFVVPPGKVASLRSFDKRIDVDTAKNELSSQTESEDMNYLVLNLAVDIVKGKRSAAQARAFYIKTAELANSGKTSAYLQGLLFQKPPSDDDY